MDHEQVPRDRDNATSTLILLLHHIRQTEISLKKSFIYSLDLDFDDTIDNYHHYTDEYDNLD